MGNFKVGDTVQIKEWDEMIEQYGEISDGTPNVRCGFTESMRCLCGKIATIKNIDFSDDVDLNIDTGGWFISLDMLKHVKESYLIKDHSDDMANAIEYEAKDFVTIKEVIEKMKEEENMKNEVLELWYERKSKELEEDRERRYNVFKEQGNDFLVKYNDLVLEVNEKLDSLVKEDTLYNEELLLSLNTSFTGLKYRLDESAVYSLFEKENYQIFDIQRDELNKTYEEVKAQLSLSNDLEYQLKVLKSYGIIDKKNKISE